MLQENLTLSGHVWVTLTDANGNITYQTDFDNLVVTVGKTFLCNAAIASSTSPFTNMAIGTGTNAPAAGDTTLQTEVARTTFSSATVATNVITFGASFGPGVGTGAITEAGIFNNTVGGTMLSHVVFSVVNKGAADTLVFTWQVTLS